MRTGNPLRLTAKRFIAALMAWTMVFAQVETAYAALTALADIPIAAKVAAKPNIVYTLDDSGSMKFNFLPDYITSTSSVIPISNITRSAVAPGTTATATLTAANNALLSVGDFITINGVSPPEYNGFFVITAKPTLTTFTYTLASVPVGTTTVVAAGYAQRQVVVSTAYCRGNTTATGCTQQAFNISPTTTYPITSITRPAASTLATATVSAANNALLTTGDFITIQGATQPEYNGYFQITKINATQFQYTMLAVPAVSPAGGGSKQFVLVGGTWAAPPLHASDFNRLAYNPAVTYLPPVVYNLANPNGTPMTSPGTDANGNYGTTPTLYGTASVERDPFANYEVAAGETPMWTYATKDNLSLRVNVQVYCNTDWPILVNDPNGINVRDVGDANGQYSASAGGYCRINGTKYDAHASGAPVADADYNYPWQKQSGADDAKYFWRQLSNKTIYCDTTSPWRPRTGTITSCRTGTPNYSGGMVQQRCVRGGNICNPTVASRNYTPANCKTDPANLFCAPNVGGSDGNSLGTGALPECIACTCNADTLNPNGSCQAAVAAVSTNAACNSAFGVWGGNLAQCPDVPNTIANCNGGIPNYAVDSLACGKFLFNPYTNTPTATTLLQDADGAGVMCRHNNIAYAVGGVASGMWTYPRTRLLDVDPANQSGWSAPFTNQLGQFQTGVTSGCPAVGTTVAIPRHYYVLQPIAGLGAPVAFCDDYINTANDQWRGFGTGVCTDASGNAQTKNDLARFKNVKYGRFVRVDLFAGNTLKYPDSSGTSVYPPNGDGVPRQWLVSSPTVPTPDNSESVNYANWYAYYSTRLSAGKTTSSIAFSALTTPPSEPINYRVGFHNFGDESPPNGADGTGASIKWVNVRDWDSTQRTAWYAALFGIAVAFNRTPTMNAMLRVGGLFESGGPTPPDASVNPLPGTAADPIDRDAANNLISCQNNYHILFTDGVTNQNGLPTTAGDYDATVPPFMQSVVEVPPEKVLTNFRPPVIAAGGPLPSPFVQGSPAVANTLADIAIYYWARDLRPALTNDVPNQSGASGGDLDWTKDVAWWQHINFSAISFGAEGTLDAVKQSATMSAIKAGTQSWPNLTTPNNPIYPKGAAKGAVAVDDLWHATTVSRGSFVYARTPTEVAYGLASILAGIQNQRKSRAAAAFSGQILDATTNVIFIPTIEPGWAGDLIKREIDPVTAAVTQTFWNASSTLAAQIDPVATGVAEPWMDENHRRVVTIAGAFGPGTATGGVAFRHANLHSDQKLSLAPAPGGNTLKQEKLVSYLRGGNTFTPISGTPVYQIEGTSIGQFRKRYGALGDISNAEPVIVNPPDRPYKDATDPGYIAWKATKSARPTVVVAPANDGMVHVFDAGPMPHAGATPTDPPVPAAPGGGQELFAFIPKALFRGVAGSVATEDVTAIQALAYQDGGVPIYHHHMYVDSSPREADVDFSGGAGTDWRSIVVGGLGKGGNSYYALDLTNVSVADEATAASKVLWEWSDAEVKYTYGRPVIVKVRDSAYAYGRWVVIVTGGYNNATGLGKVFFLDATNGTLLSTVTTSAGTAANPSGLAQIHAFVKDQSNQIAEQIYGGDLLGNLWRIDVSGVNQYKTATAVQFAYLNDGVNAQPVTTAPQIEIDVNNGVDRYVFIGTGQLLDQKDLTVPNPPRQQTFYAIRDGTLQAMRPDTDPLLPINVRSGILKSVNTDSDGTGAITGGAPDGWLHDLPNIPGVGGDAQRIVVDVQANVNVAQYVGTKVQDDPCVISLPAVLYARDYTTARSLILDPTDLTGNTLLPFYDLPSGAVGNLTVGVRLPDGSWALSALISEEIPGTKPIKLQNPVTGPGNRLSWRLLGVE
ncbi:MAG: PilC/PilY family type IV pilus protein [Burkholderiales bacterium]